MQFRKIRAVLQQGLNDSCGILIESLLQVELSFFELCSNIERGSKTRSVASYCGDCRSRFVEIFEFMKFFELLEFFKVFHFIEFFQLLEIVRSIECLQAL